MIAATVASDPEKYSEAILGKSNQDYCAWIMNPEKWGGLFLQNQPFGVILTILMLQTGCCTEKRYFIIKNLFCTAKSICFKHMYLLCHLCLKILIKISSSPGTITILLFLLFLHVGKLLAKEENVKLLSFMYCAS